MSCSRRRQWAMTLIESLVVTSMFLSALVMIGSLFLYGSRFTRGGDERTDMAQIRLAAADTLRRALAGSTYSGNTALYQDPLGTAQDDLAVSLITCRDAAGNSGWDPNKQKPLFRGYLVFYRNATDDTLRTFRVDITETSIAAPLSPDQVRTHIASAQGQTLAKSVQTFQLFSPTDSTVASQLSNPIGLRLVQSTSRGTPVVTDLPFKFPI